MLKPKKITQSELDKKIPVPYLIKRATQQRIKAIATLAGLTYDKLFSYWANQAEKELRINEQPKVEKG